MKNQDREAVRNSQQDDDRYDPQQEGDQHHHDPVARPKIPKNKLPSVFNPSRKKKQERPQQEPQQQQNENRRSSTDKPERKQPDANGRKQGEQHRSKKSMNPLIPARNQIKLFDRLEVEIMEARHDFQRFARKNIDKFSAQPATVKLEHCVTLSVVEGQTNRGGQLKKVLNVPTFRLLYLQQVPISGKDNPTVVKQKLEQWDAIPTNNYQLRTQGMFWNYPEGSMSLLYQHVDTLPLTKILDACGYLPENAMKQVFGDCLAAVTLLQKNGVIFPNFDWRDVQVTLGSGKVQLRPLLDLNSQIKSQKGELLMELLAQQPSKSDRQKTLVYRFGFMLLFMALGPFILEEELNDAIKTICRNPPQKSAGRKTQSKVSNGNCCLMHLLDTLSSINNNHPELALDIPLYRSARRRFSEPLQDLICGCLRQTQSSRFKLEDLSIHRFMLHSNEQANKLELCQLLTLARAERIRENELKKPSESPLNNLLQSVDVVLSNCNSFDLPVFTEEHRTIIDLSEQLRLQPAVLSRKLNQLYGHNRR